MPRFGDLLWADVGFAVVKIAKQLHATALEAADDALVGPRDRRSREPWLTDNDNLRASPASPRIA